MLNAVRIFHSRLHCCAVRLLDRVDVAPAPTINCCGAGIVLCWTTTAIFPLSRPCEYHSITMAVIQPSKYVEESRVIEVTTPTRIDHARRTAGAAITSTVTYVANEFSTANDGRIYSKIQTSALILQILTCGQAKNRGAFALADEKQLTSGSEAGYRVRIHFRPNRELLSILCARLPADSCCCRTCENCAEPKLLATLQLAPAALYTAMCVCPALRTASVLLQRHRLACRRHISIHCRCASDCHQKTLSHDFVRRVHRRRGNAQDEEARGGCRQRQRAC